MKLHEFRWQMYLEALNELLLLMMCYHFILFHNLLSSAGLMNGVGLSFQSFVFLCIGINTMVIIHSTVR